MTTIHELIERLEKLTGPDREMDMAVLDAVAGPIERTSRRFVARVPIPEVSGSFIRRKCLPYTASLDAVMTLARDQREFIEMLGEAYHEILPPSGTRFAVKYNALSSQTVAQFLAIKAALVRALRARAEQEKV
jgi:hypothetical protein